MSTFEDHAREILEKPVKLHKFVCRSCGEYCVTDDEDTMVLGICFDCFDGMDVLPLVHTLDGYTYCTCEDRPCCGCA